MSREPQAIVALLDQQYEQLLVDARRQAAGYVDVHEAVQKDRGQICRGCRVNQENEPESLCL